MRATHKEYSTYLFWQQISTGLYSSMPSLDACPQIRALGRRLRECDAQIKRRVKRGKEVGNDVHLVNALHLDELKES